MQASNIEGQAQGNKFGWGACLLGWSLVQISVPKGSWHCSCYNGSRSLNRVFWEGGSLVIMWRRTLGRICGVEIWDSESSRFRAPKRMLRSSRPGVSLYGEWLYFSAPKQKADSKEGSRWEKLEGTAEASKPRWCPGHLWYTRYQFSGSHTGFIYRKVSDLVLQLGGESVA